MSIVKGFIVLIGLLLLGELLSESFNLPIPGSVIGMVLLFIALIVIKSVPEDVGKVSDGLVAHIGLLFVPAGAGISVYLGMIADNWLVIVLASLSSTILTLAFTALAFKLLSRGEGDVE
jgi:holin-like protein